MNTFVFFFSLFLFLSLLSFHCAAQVFAACFSAPVHQLYGYTVTTPELRRSSCDWVVDSCIVVVPDCTVDAMPFRWNWTLSAIQQCQTFLSWRNLPAAEQREKMVSPLLCIFLTRLHTSWIEHFAFIIGWMRNVQTKVSKRAVSGHIEREASLLLCPTSLAKANADCLIMSVVLEIWFPFLCTSLPGPDWAASFLGTSLCAACMWRWPTQCTRLNRNNGTWQILPVTQHSPVHNSHKITFAYWLVQCMVMPRYSTVERTLVACWPKWPAQLPEGLTSLF